MLERGFTDGPNVSREDKVLQTKDPCCLQTLISNPGGLKSGGRDGGDARL